MHRNRSSFSFPDFSLRRLLLQARAARGSQNQNGNRCDVEKGSSSSSKNEKSVSSNKVKILKKNFLQFLKIMIIFWQPNSNDTSSQSSGGATTSRGDRISIVYTEKSPKNRDKIHSTANFQQNLTESSQECQLCYTNYDRPDEMYTIFNCKHVACRNCLERYLEIEITESRTDIGK